MLVHSIWQESGFRGAGLICFMPALLISTGCTSVEPSRWQGSGHLPDDIHVVRLFVKTNSESFSYKTPAGKVGAINGMVGMFAPSIFTEAIVAFPMYAASSVLIGSLRGIPEEKTRQAEAVLKKGFERMEVCQGLARALQKAGGEAFDYEWRLEKEARPIGNTNLQELWMLLEFSEVRLEPQHNNEIEINPKLTFVLSAQLSIEQSTDGRELYFKVWDEPGESHTFLNWAEKDGESLRRSLTICSEQLAQRIIREIFGPLTKKGASKPLLVFEVKE
jgi:hypothetical protein